MGFTREGVAGPLGGSSANALAQFNGPTGRLLKSGPAVVTAISGGGSDSEVPTSAAVAAAVAAGPGGGGVLASNVAFTPTGSIAATDVQAALEELGTEKLQDGTQVRTAGQYAPVNSGAITPLAGTLTIDFNTRGNVVEVTLDANVTSVVLNNAVAKGRYVLVLKQDATGNRTVTGWPTIKWNGGSGPTLTTAANKIDIITLIRTNAGEWLGSSVLNF